MKGSAAVCAADLVQYAAKGNRGTCEDEKIGGDAEAAAREGGDETAGEEGRGYVIG